MFKTILKAVLSAIYHTEKRIFQRTGIKLPLYVLIRKDRGQRIQKALNRQHGTNYTYNGKPYKFLNK